MKNIELIAVDIDGVILPDTFSPVLYRLTKKYGVDYTAELENNTFSQNRNKAASYLKKALNIDDEITIEQVLNIYFEERKLFCEERGNFSEKTYENKVINFINTLRNSKAKIICYGGLPFEKIDQQFKLYVNYFEEYICTNDFRPGLKEIVKDIYNIDYSKVLFIDDVNRMAIEAKKFNCPFIGVPSRNSWSYQELEMKKTGVKYLVESIGEITTDYLKNIDLDSNIWKG